MVESYCSIYAHRSSSFPWVEDRLPDLAHGLPTRGAPYAGKSPGHEVPLVGGGAFSCGVLLLIVMLFGLPKGGVRPSHLPPPEAEETQQQS